MPYTDVCETAHVTLTLLLIEVTVDVPLHLCIAPVAHPGQVFTGDGRTHLVVERSGGEGYSLVKTLYIRKYKLDLKSTKLSSIRL